MRDRSPGLNSVETRAGIHPPDSRPPQPQSTHTSRTIDRRLGADWGRGGCGGPNRGGASAHAWLFFLGRLFQAATERRQLGLTRRGTVTTKPGCMQAHGGSVLAQSDDGGMVEHLYRFWDRRRSNCVDIGVRMDRLADSVYVYAWLSATLYYTMHVRGPTTPAVGRSHSFIRSFFALVITSSR